MDDLDKLNKIEQLMGYFLEGERNRSLNKMAGKITLKMFNDLCKEYAMCDVCGKELDKSGKIRIWERSRTSLTKDIETYTCPDVHCQYNKNLTDRLQNEEYFKGALYR